MKKNNSEEITPTNDEGGNQPDDSNEPNEELTKAKELADNYKVRAEKAEAKLKNADATKEKPKTPKNEGESDEPNYDKLAYLEVKGVTNSDDQKVVKDEAKRLNLPLTEILEMEHIKGKLKTAKEQREAENSMPDKSGKSGVDSKGTVEHWVDKKNEDGSLATPKDIKLANEVIDARMNQSSDNKMFDDTF